MTLQQMFLSLNTVNVSYLVASCYLSLWAGNNCGTVVELLVVSGDRCELSN